MTTVQTRYPQAPALQNGESVIGIRCVKCDLWITRECWENTDRSFGISCVKCGTALTDSEGAPDTRENLGVVADDWNLYDGKDVDTPVRERLWFHVTHQEDWLNENRDKMYGGEHFPHVGSAMTVRDLYLQQSAGKGEMFLYAVRIREMANVKTGAAIDDAITSWAPVMRDESVEDVQVVRYINDYENPGAVSLVTTVDSLAIMDSTKFTGKDDLMDKIAELTARFT